MCKDLFIPLMFQNGERFEFFFSNGQTPWPGLGNLNFSDIYLLNLIIFGNFFNITEVDNNTIYC